MNQLPYTKLPTSRFNGVRRDALLQQIKATVHNFLPDAEVILYGSQARREATQESDWDILVLTDARVTFDLERQIWHQLDAISLEEAVVISAMVYNRQDWQNPIMTVTPYFANVMRDGITI